MASIALILAVAPTAFAGKGGTHGNNTSGGSASPLALVMLSDVNTPGVSYGDVVTFNVSTSAPYPSVQLDCYQGSTAVYSHVAPFYPSAGASQNYTLGSWYWTGGGADCTATLYYTTNSGTNSTLAMLNFSVSA